MEITLASQRAQPAVNLSGLPLEITNSPFGSIFTLCRLNFDRFQTDSKPAYLINEHYSKRPRALAKADYLFAGAVLRDVPGVWECKPKIHLVAWFIHKIKKDVHRVFPYSFSPTPNIKMQ